MQVSMLVIMLGLHLHRQQRQQQWQQQQQHLQTLFLDRLQLHRVARSSNLWLHFDNNFGIYRLGSRRRGLAQAMPEVSAAAQESAVCEIDP